MIASYGETGGFLGCQCSTVLSLSCLAQFAEAMINAPSLAPPSLWRKGASRGLAMGNAEMTTFPVKRHATCLC
ncbi:hypothetical protein F5X97DRAFT_291490 [Nemania serpens]|nr:hypothetical protein F5X97DRAFT_291490 [Nemania serpens]